MNNIICDYMNNMNENQPNPKCPICRCYFVPTLKSSGLPYKSCEKCRNKNRDYKIKIKCEHNRRKENCRDCRGASLCEHNRRKENCRDCGGSQICEHNKRKSICINCGGASLCEHNRRKEFCLDCGGSQICEHNKQKSSCKDCGGASLCKHNKRKSRCKDCGGASLCEHNRRKENCKDCNIKLYLVQLQRGQINRCFKSSILDKNKHSIEYLGCDIETFINCFQKKMDYYNQFMATDELMTFANVHIDHIKPVSKFNLDNEEEFLDCCNYTNLQPLLAKDNLEKSNKWNDTNELYWKENIINKNYFEIYH